MFHSFLHNIVKQIVLKKKFIPDNLNHPTFLYQHFNDDQVGVLPETYPIQRYERKALQIDDMLKIGLKLNKTFTLYKMFFFLKFAGDWGKIYKVESVTL